MKSIDYSSFAKTCVDELKTLQEKFQEDYEVDGYENWFYNQTTGLLTFSTDDTQVNFKYVDVGSFSPKSNTWKWSWDNEHTLDNVKGPIKILKEFGEKNGYSKLTTGCFPSDEYEAWEFTGIAAKLMNGIGVYRPVNDEGLQIYLVATEFVDNSTAQEIKNRYVRCRTHEYKRRAFVCQHLNHATKVGFEEAFETFEDMELLEDDDLQAWCDECEEMRQKEGEWNERSMAFARIKVVCEECYFEMKKLNLGYR